MPRIRFIVAFHCSPCPLRRPVPFPIVTDRYLSATGVPRWPPADRPAVTVAACAAGPWASSPCRHGRSMGHPDPDRVGGRRIERHRARLLPCGPRRRRTGPERPGRQVGSGQAAGVCGLARVFEGPAARTRGAGTFRQEASGRRSWGRQAPHADVPGWCGRPAQRSRAAPPPGRQPPDRMREPTGSPGKACGSTPRSRPGQRRPSPRVNSTGPVCTRKRRRVGHHVFAIGRRELSSR